MYFEVPDYILDRLREMEHRLRILTNDLPDVAHRDRLRQIVNVLRVARQELTRA